MRALNAVADEGVVESKLIAGLRIEADAAAEQGSHIALRAFFAL